MDISIFRVSSEYYDKAWLVRSKSKKTAIKTVRVMTEEQKWHLDAQDDEKIRFEVEKVLEKSDEPTDVQDI